MARETSAIDRIRRLDEERAAVLDDAKKEAMAKANEAVKELNSLGFSYKLVSEGRSSRKSAVSEGGACNVCGFTTDPPHDGRKHRSQGEKKKAFTKSELAALGMERVD